MSSEAIMAAAAISSTDPVVTQLGQTAVQAPATAGSNGFAEILNNFVGDAENKVNEANDLVRQFAVDNSIPVHKVTFALEEARLSVEMMMQVRTRLVEGYRQIMNMQL